MTEKRLTSKLLPFAAKKIGSNIIISTGKERFSKKVTKEEGEAILKKIELYNKRPSDDKKKQIIKLVAPEAAKKSSEVEKIKSKAKGLKSQVKKAAKKNKTVNKDAKTFLVELEELLQSDETAVDTLQKILDKYKRVEEAKPAAVAAPVIRRGEY